MYAASDVQGRRSRCRRGWLNVSEMDEEVFREQFRFAKRGFDTLLSLIDLPACLRSAQGVVVNSDEALCIALRRLAYPNRLCDLENIFGRRSSTLSSVSTIVLKHIDLKFGHLLDDINNHRWLNLDSLEIFSRVRKPVLLYRNKSYLLSRSIIDTFITHCQAVHMKGAPQTNCWAFIDGTARAICRPSEKQREYFSGHKRHHVQKFQAVMCPNGVICELDGPYKGHRHDAGELNISTLKIVNRNIVEH